VPGAARRGVHERWGARTAEPKPAREEDGSFCRVWLVPYTPTQRGDPTLWQVPSRSATGKDLCPVRQHFPGRLSGTACAYGRSGGVHLDRATPPFRFGGLLEHDSARITASPELGKAPCCSAITLCRETGRFHGGRVSMVCFPAILRNSATPYALLPSSAATPGSPLSHCRESGQPTPGRAFH
jgi:hypothetical protein